MELDVALINYLAGYLDAKGTIKYFLANKKNPSLRLSVEDGANQNILILLKSLFKGSIYLVKISNYSKNIFRYQVTGHHAVQVFNILKPCLRKNLTNWEQEVNLFLTNYKKPVKGRKADYQIVVSQSEPENI